MERKANYELSVCVWGGGGGGGVGGVRGKYYPYPIGESFLLTIAGLITALLQCILHTCCRT